MKTENSETEEKLKPAVDPNPGVGRFGVCLLAFMGGVMVVSALSKAVGDGRSRKFATANPSEAIKIAIEAGMPEGLPKHLPACREKFNVTVSSEVTTKEANAVVGCAAEKHRVEILDKAYEQAKETGDYSGIVLKP